MSEFCPHSTNAEQVAYWNGEGGQGWAERDRQMEKTLGPIGAQAIHAASVQVGESALDIGCGCAGSTFGLLEKVGKTGRVLGVDISEPMLKVAAAAASQLPEAMQSAVAFEQADASTHPFEAASFDLAFSRFGVMFFADPPTAFANIRQALKPGGRLAFICWAPVPENEWITVPMGAALQHLTKPEPMPPNAPGPFGLANREFTLQALQEAGFENITIASYRPLMRFGHDMPQDRVADFFIDAGPVSRLLADAAPDQVESVRRAMREAIAPYYADGTINLNASCWIVTADNS